MSRKKVLLLALVAILLAASGFAWQQAAAAYQRPLAAPLAMEVQASPTGVLTPTSTPQAEICGQSGEMTILFLARDKSTGEWPYGADLIRFARVDFNNKTIRLIAVPRDLWVETPHLGYLNLDHSRLGLVYYRVEQNTTGTAKEIATASTSAVAQALYDNYNIAADHYIFFEMRYFADAIDQLGGLDVNIPADISVGDYSFHAGEQHLDGLRALLYARLLPGNELSDGWNRMDRQNLILKALIAKLLEPASIVKIPELIQKFNEIITTDLSPELITNLDCLADKVPQNQITNVRVERDMITGAGPDSSMIADTEKVKQFLQEQLAP
jgi:LCP family protein required for cell wall assembly